MGFNDVVSLTINGIYSAYLIGNGLLLWRRVTGRIRPYNRDNTTLVNISEDTLMWGPTRIPEPFGTVVNAFGCAYLLVLLFFSFWPTAINPTVQTMNMSSLMVGVTIIWSIVYYLVWARKFYTGPVIETGRSSPR